MATPSTPPPAGSPPLAGVRVLLVGWGMPLAVAGALLGDYGADVVHIRRPGGDPARRSGATATWERGVRFAEADLMDVDQRLAVQHLAATADIAIVALRGPAATGFGLDPATLAAANPALVVALLSGFGQHDHRDTVALDVLVAAELGAMVTAPGHRPGPVFLGHPAIAYSTAFLTVIGVLGALRGRLRSGWGDVVDVSLRHGVLAQLTMNWWSESRSSFLRSRTRSGGLDLGTTRMVLRRFRTADGKLIQVHSGAAGAFGRLMKVLGLAAAISEATGPVESACPLTEADLAVLERMPEIFGSRTAEEWLQELWANEIAALPVQQPGEVFDDAQVACNQLLQPLEHPDLGLIEVVGPPIVLQDSPAVSPLQPPRRIGLAEGWLAGGLGSGGQRSEPARRDGPLSGVRIAEFASFFAAPYANRLLAELGADVIKVEPISGDPIRTLADPFEGASQGKRSVALDVKAPAARPFIEALLRSVDVVQHNLRPGAAERLGIDHGAVRALNPEVIYDYAPGYGSTGPKSRLQSFAPLHSGFVGVHAEAAGAGNEPLPTFGNEDYYNGQLNAIATLLALVHRARGGSGQYVECPQLNSSVFVTSHWYRAAAGPVSTLPQLDTEQTGWGPAYRLYQCLDGWLCVACVTHEQRSSFAEAVLGPDADLDVDRLQYELFGRSTGAWCEALGRAGVPVAVVNEERWLHHYLLDEHREFDGSVNRFLHAQHGQVRTIGRLVDLAGVAPRGTVRAPRIGEHTRAVAAELGLEDGFVDRLVTAGVARVAPSEPGDG